MKKVGGFMALFVLLGCGAGYAADDLILPVTTDVVEEAPLVDEGVELGAQSDIVDTAVAAGNFKTLAAALEAAGLIETLKGAGPFTVFAPSDDAFAKQAPGTVEEWLKPENKDKLVAVLTYHVVPGKVMAADVQTMKAATVSGKELDVVKTDAGVTVDGANVVTTDIECSNGVIHVVDQVLMPKEV